MNAGILSGPLLLSTWRKMPILEAGFQAFTKAVVAETLMYCKQGFTD